MSSLWLANVQARLTAWRPSPPRRSAGWRSTLRTAGIHAAVPKSDPSAETLAGIVGSKKAKPYRLGHRNSFTCNAGWLNRRFVTLRLLRGEPLVRYSAGQIQHPTQIVLQRAGKTDPSPSDGTVAALQGPDDVGRDWFATHETIHWSSVFRLVLLIRFRVL